MLLNFRDGRKDHTKFFFLPLLLLEGWQKHSTIGPDQNAPMVKVPLSCVLSYDRWNCTKRGSLVRPLLSFSLVLPFGVRPDRCWLSLTQLVKLCEVSVLPLLLHYAYNVASCNLTHLLFAHQSKRKLFFPLSLTLSSPPLNFLRSSNFNLLFLLLTPLLIYFSLPTGYKLNLGSKYSSTQREEK